MKNNVERVQSEYDRAMSSLNTRLDGLLTSELGKDIKTNPETIAALTASFMDTNKVLIVDPIELSKKAKELEEEIDTFESNVDWVLSEANGKTMITV
jgi:uncharacterized protein YhaN